MLTLLQMRKFQKIFIANILKLMNLGNLRFLPVMINFIIMCIFQLMMDSNGVQLLKRDIKSIFLFKSLKFRSHHFEFQILLQFSLMNQSHKCSIFEIRLKQKYIIFQRFMTATLITLHSNLNLNHLISSHMTRIQTL